MTLYRAGAAQDEAVVCALGEAGAPARQPALHVTTLCCACDRAPLGRIESAPESVQAGQDADPHPQRIAAQRKLLLSKMPSSHRIVNSLAQVATREPLPSTWKPGRQVTLTWSP